MLVKDADSPHGTANKDIVFSVDGDGHRSTHCSWGGRRTILTEPEKEFSLRGEGLHSVVHHVGNVEVPFAVDGYSLRLAQMTRAQGTASL